MKKLLPAILLFSVLSLNAQIAQVQEPVKIIAFQNPMTPLIILDHFARHNPDAVPFWGMEGRNYTVRYIDPNTNLGHKLVYDKHGTILRRENELAVSDCPESLQQYYQKNYPDEQINIWSYEETDEKKFYFKRNSQIVWFDKEGNYLKKRFIWN